MRKLVSGVLIVLTVPIARAQDACESKAPLPISIDASLDLVLEKVKVDKDVEHTCKDGDGKSRTYLRVVGNVLVDKECFAGTPPLVDSGVFAKGVEAAFKTGLGCVAKQGEAGKQLAKNIVDLVDSCDLSCSSSPRPLRLRCDHPNSKNAAFTEGPSKKDFPSISFEPKSLKTSAKRSDAADRIAKTLTHEFIHLTGSDHGREIDFAYASGACCFPDLNRAVDTQLVRAAGCRVLSGIYTEPSNSAYLKDYRIILAAQSASSVFSLSFVAFMNVPVGDRTKKWPEGLLVWVREAIDRGNLAFAQSLAEAEIAKLDPKDSQVNEYKTLSQEAAKELKSSPVSKSLQEAAAMVAELIVHAQIGDLDGKALQRRAFEVQTHLKGISTEDVSKAPESWEALRAVSDVILALALP